MKGGGGGDVVGGGGRSHHQQSPGDGSGGGGLGNGAATRGGGGPGGGRSGLGGGKGEGSGPSGGMLHWKSHPVQSDRPQVYFEHHEEHGGTPSVQNQQPAHDETSCCPPQKLSSESGLQKASQPSSPGLIRGAASFFFN